MTEFDNASTHVTSFVIQMRAVLMKTCDTFDMLLTTTERLPPFVKLLFLVVVVVVVVGNM